MTRWRLFTVPEGEERKVAGERSKAMEPAVPFTFAIALVARRSASGWNRMRGGSQTHKRHEAGPQGVVV